MCEVSCRGALYSVCIIPRAQTCVSPDVSLLLDVSHPEENDKRVTRARARGDLECDRLFVQTGTNLNRTIRLYVHVHTHTCTCVHVTRIHTRTRGKGREEHTFRHATTRYNISYCVQARYNGRCV